MPKIYLENSVMSKEFSMIKKRCLKLIVSKLIVSEDGNLNEDKRLWINSAIVLYVYYS